MAYNYSLANRIEFVNNVTLTTYITSNCSCPYTNISRYTIQEIDPLTEELIRSINITGFPSSNTASLFLPNGTLKYGLYKFTFNFTIITNDETAAPFVSIIDEYIKIVPTGFVVSGFEIVEGEMPQTTFTVSPTDTIAFIPAYFSYDIDGLSDSKSLDYKFYCILVDENYDLINPNITLNFTNDLYWISPKDALNREQLEAENTCFKQEGSFL